MIHFVASGEYAFSAARVTVDVRLEEGARLNVTLTSPSGGSENLTMDRDGRRYSWTGQLREAGTWRAEATVSGAGSPQSASATVSLGGGHADLFAEHQRARTGNPLSRGRLRGEQL